MPIFDQGYQHWRGPLSGHGWRWLAIARHGVRVQMKNRILRMLLLVAWLPAVVLVAALAGWGLVEQRSEGVLALARNFLPADVLLDARAYRLPIWALAFSNFFKVQMLFIMLLVVIAGPGLISRDLRFNALPLYFARPLTRLDYFLGKLGVIGAVVGAVAVGPAALAYVVGVCFCLDLSVVSDTYTVLVGSVAFGLLVTLSTGTLMLALSSMSRRSLYVGIAFAGIWIISGSVGSIMTTVHRETSRRAGFEIELARWVEEHPPPPGVQMHGAHAIRVQPNQRDRKPDGVEPEANAAADRWYADWAKAAHEARLKSLTGMADRLRSDWRPLCSYVANLDRMADLFLDTDSAWVTLGRTAARSRTALGGAFGAGRRGAEVDEFNERRLADQFVPQYPWQWSAGVLAGIWGLSIWILTRRVKSLDQLR